MTLIEFVKHLFMQQPMQDEGWSREEQEALIDLLLLGMYVDGNLSQEETDLLDKEVHDISAETGTDWNIYVSKAIHQVQSVQGKQEEQHYLLQDIRERLGDFEKRYAAAQQLKILLIADGKVPEEDSFLDEVQALFRIRPLPGDDD